MERSVEPFAAGWEEFVLSPWALEPVSEREPPGPGILELEPLPEPRARIHKAEPIPTVNTSLVHAGLGLRSQATLDLHSEEGFLGN